MSKLQKVERMLKYAEGSFKWLLHALVSTTLFVLFDLTYLGHEGLFFTCIGFSIGCVGGMIVAAYIIRQELKIIENA